MLTVGLLSGSVLTVESLQGGSASLTMESAHASRWLDWRVICGLTGCWRTMNVAHGVDGVAHSDWTVVEGEIDKLAIEAVGFLNCVSVPCEAPQKVSAKALPQQEKDTGYQYIWYCKEHLDKDSCIILVTDGDIPGQALAEELARHLGKQRCSYYGVWSVAIGSHVSGSRCSEGSNKKCGVVSATSSRPSKNAVYIKLI
ncbi:hypothetical protein Patl1_11543 [Pistacia atlantica]|uniref:Uncharacterized protein n=1 Tax=Pistacia atlantica TaxID=434234 RepID=A0ACC1A870_9ROSI|nr:hypothetical protein Patl1_11543 [Pistacia atlantica]